MKQKEKTLIQLVLTVSKQITIPLHEFKLKNN